MKSGWSRKFEEPIPLPRGRQLVTLKDAGTYITKLPKAEHTAAEWQAAMEALILVATLGGPTMFARIGVMRALNRQSVEENAGAKAPRLRRWLKVYRDPNLESSSPRHRGETCHLRRSVSRPLESYKYQTINGTEGLPFGRAPP
jgi:hypothetical protein